MNNDQWRTGDLDVLWHQTTQMKDHASLPMIPIRSDRAGWPEDFDGKRYIDAIGSWCVNLFDQFDVPGDNMRRGLHVYRHALDIQALPSLLGNVVYFMPPYVISDDEIDHLARDAVAGIDKAAAAE